MPKKLGYKPDYTLHPGATLLEVIQERKMTQVHLSKLTGLTPKHVNQIIKEKVNITADVALRLEYALDIKAEVWMNLQTNHELAKLRLGMV